jgi:hypothetical protein
MLVTPLGSGWYRCVCVFPPLRLEILKLNQTKHQRTRPKSYAGDGVSGVCVAPTNRIGTPPPPTNPSHNGSTYATDFPIFQLYDGVDDGMATAAFSAGTLITAWTA